MSGAGPLRVVASPPMAPTEPVTLVAELEDTHRGVGWVTVTFLVLALVHVILFAALVLVLAFDTDDTGGLSETNVTQTQNLGPEVSDAQVGPETELELDDPSGTEADS